MLKNNIKKYLIGTMAVIIAIAALMLVFMFHKQKQMNEHLITSNQDLLEQNEKLQQDIAYLTNTTDGVKEHGMLSVQESQLVDQDGNPLMLKGMSSHGIAWYPEYTNYSSLKTLKEYGANVFRIAMYVDQNDGYLDEPKLNKKLLYSAIENSLAADLYTIVDWHVLKDENPNHNIEEAIAFFEDVAKRYGDNPGVIYEICNEPNGDTTYEDIVHYAKQVIPIIRKYAPDSLILVGTPNFCTSLSQAIDNPLPYANIMYTYHYYAGVSDCAFAMEEIAKAIQSGLCVFVSEWGIDTQEASRQDWQDTADFLDYLEQEKISWINWSFCNKDENYSMIQSDNLKLHSWSQEDLSESGKFVLNYLSQK